MGLQFCLNALLLIVVHQFTLIEIYIVLNDYANVETN